MLTRITKILLVLSIITVSTVNAQTTLLYEGFENLPLKFTSSTTASSSASWARNTTLFSAGNFSDSAFKSQGDTTFLTSELFSTKGLKFIMLDFDQICKISTFDTGYVEVSNDNGKTWHKISRRAYYLGPDVSLGGAFWGVTGKSQGFNELTYPGTWTSFIPPNNSYWRHETFNISNFLGDSLGLKDNSSDSCRLRFSLDGATTTPSISNRGWFLDEILLTGALCETEKPAVSLASPSIDHNSFSYSQGPFQINAIFSDKLSGIDTAYMYYQVNNGSWDSVGMEVVYLPNGLWRGFIPKYYGVNDTVQVGDSICYYIKVYDKSVPCRNSSIIPDLFSTGRTCNKFYIEMSETIPYFQDFESYNKWSDSTFYGPLSPTWQMGDPSPGGYNAFSGSNAWTTNLNGAHPANTLSYLYSPIFDFSNARNCILTFMQYRDINFNTKLSIQYSINGVSWQTLGVRNDTRGEYIIHPNCTTSTWYDSGSSSNPYHWNNSTMGWEKSYYELPAVFNNQSYVRFRFRFDSGSNSLNKGVSIDDFHIYPQPPSDLSVLEVIHPGSFLINQLNFIKQAGDLDSIQITIQNKGADTLKTVDLSIKIDTAGGSLIFPATYTYDANSSFPLGLPSGEIDTIVLSDKYKIPSRTYNLSVISSQAADNSFENDTAYSAGHFGFRTFTLPVRGEILNNFDSVEQQWSTLPNARAACGPQPANKSNHWERGYPNYGATNSTFSGVNSWDINLDSSYKVNADEFLYSPFYDLSSSGFAYVSLWFNTNTTTDQDGLRLEFRLADNNGPWTSLLQSSPPSQGVSNWFDASSLFSGKGWSGNSNGWTYAQYLINPIIPQGSASSLVQFRFRFLSDAQSGSNMEGVSIDDFKIVNPDSIDIGLLSIYPGQKCLAGREKVTVTVRNNGFLPVDSIPVCFNYRQGTISPPFGSGSICDTIYDTIFPGTQVQFSFDSLIDMSIFGFYQFNAWLDKAMDQNRENDSLFNQLAEIQEGCELEVRLSTDSIIPAGAKWMIIDTAINDTILTYPFSQIGNKATNWKEVFCLASGGEYKFVISPSSINFTSNIRLKNLGLNMVALNSTQQLSSGFDWDCIPPLDMSSINIKPSSSVQLPVEQTYSFQHKIKNSGLFPVQDVLISLEVIQTSPVSSIVVLQTDTFHISSSPSTALQLMEDTTYSFAGSLNLSPGSYTISSWTSQPNFVGDNEPINDTSRIQLSVIDSVDNISSPFCDNFDITGSPTIKSWASLTSSSYQQSSSYSLGTPSQSLINSASTSPNSWMTGLSSNYQNSENSSLYSPLFFISDTSVCYQVSFSHQYKTEYLFDGGKLEYSIDSGVSWVQVGELLDSLSASNWYNSPFVSSLNGNLPSPGWSGNSSNYIQSSHDINFSNHLKKDFYVLFRFKFASDISTNDEGWSIDDFCFGIGGNCKFYSCFDQVQNGLETGIDCGGPECKPCPTCFDGLLNGLETGVDCGGPECLPCPTCNDGIQNGGELGVDCGGPVCPPCPPSCFDGIMNGQETGIDCGGPECKPCPLPIGIENLKPAEFALGQNQPNPATNITNIPFYLPKNGKVLVEFLDVLGKVVDSKTIEGKSGENLFKIDVSAWNKGIYYYRFDFNGTVKVDRMSVL